MEGSVTGRFPISDGSSITWYEPPPVETITDTNSIRTVDRNFTKGFEEQLSWNVSLPSGSTIITVTLELASINRIVATYVAQPVSLSVSSGFQDRFNVIWIPSKITLTSSTLLLTTRKAFSVRCSLLVEARQIHREGKLKWPSLVRSQIFDA